jgi:hypothetical protein
MKGEDGTEGERERERERVSELEREPEARDEHRQRPCRPHSCYPR